MRVDDVVIIIALVPEDIDRHVIRHITVLRFSLYCIL